MDNGTLEYFERQIEKLSTDIQHLQLKLLVLKELRDEVPANATSFDPIPEQNENGLGPTAAIKRALMRMPGLNANEVVERLIDKVSSAADNRRHTLKSTIFNLVKQGDVSRHKNGRLYLVSKVDEHHDG